MAKINFKGFILYSGISKKETQVVDVRESFANLLYCETNGIKTHALAFKIYNSEGDVELNKDEQKLIKAVASEYCTPAFIDSIKDKLTEEQL